MHSIFDFMRVLETSRSRLFHLPGPIQTDGEASVHPTDVSTGLAFV